MLEQEKPWNPLTIAEVSVQLAGATFPWWIAGGYAIELALGEPVRDHSDLDILVFRRDHLRLRELLSDWDCWVADPPGVLRPWPLGESLDSAVHDVWCRQTPGDAWRLQVMLDESDGERWCSRRDFSISASIDDITWKTDSGIRFLAPHIQLFYKAKNIREKDQADFDAVMDSGTAFDSAWLGKAISEVYGPEHPWLKRLPQ